MRRFLLIVFGLILGLVGAAVGYVTYRLYVILPDNVAPSQAEYQQAALDLLKLTSRPRDSKVIWTRPKVSLPEWMNFSSEAARKLFARLSPERYERVQRDWHVNFFLASAWVGLRWSEKEKLSTILHEQGYGPHAEWRGLEQASQGFFGAPASDLSIPEVAVLVVNLRAFSNYEPWCSRDLVKEKVLKLLERYKQAFPDAQFDSEQMFSRLKPAPASIPVACRP